MRIIFVDNEQSSHINFCHALGNHTDVTSLDCFYKADAAIKHAQHNPVDCAFLDIGLDDNVSGLDLAQDLKAIQPHIEIAFVTAFNDHARASYQLGGRAYITKPCSAKEIEDALDIMQRLRDTRKHDLTQDAPTRSPVQIRTFGNFDLIIDGCAVAFKTAKAKEALAFLVHQSGSSVSGAQIFFALWEAQEYTSVTSTYVRRTIHALEEELQALGIEDMLIRSRNCYRIATTRLNCDSYALLNGDEHAANLFDGEYMRQYSWGESAIPLLERAAKKIRNAHR